MPAIAHQNKILGNTSGGGSTIKVTTSESTLYGQTVTLSDGTTTMSGTFSGTGECEFTGVMMVGTLTATSGAASTSINVPYFGVYTMSLAFFSATITVTYSGGTCTCVGNGESYTASGSPYTFTVHGAATYTITNTIDGISKTDTVTITTDGQSESVSIEFGTINVTYDNDFRGATVTCSQGGTSISKVAPSGGNTMSFYPPTTGTWDISANVGGTTYGTQAIITSLSTPESATLQTLATISVTMYGAAGATISWTDAAGAKTTTLDSTGTKTGVSIVIQSGQTITFTDTNVAKNPDDLSANYTKTVTLTSSTTEVYVMPDNALYWYGYNNPDNPMIDASSANGWTAWNTGFIQPSYNQTNIYVMATGSGKYSAAANTNAVTATTIHAISQVTSQGGINVSASKALNDSNFVARFAQGTTLAHNQQTISTQAVYIAPFGVNGNGRGVYLYALWYE